MVKVMAVPQRYGCRVAIDIERKGNKFVFMSSYLFKLTAGKEFKADKDFGFDGRIVNCRLLKTRSGYNATTLPLVYHSKRGFHDEMTNVYFLKEQGLLKGGGSKGFHLPDAEEHRFTQREFLKLYRSNEEFAQKFEEFVAEQFSKVIDAKSADEEHVTASDKSSMEDEFED